MNLHDLRIVLGIIFFAISSQTFAQSGNSSSVSTGASTGSTPTSSPAITTVSNSLPGSSSGAPVTATSLSPTISTPSADEICSQNNGSCHDCLGVPGAKCLWCNSDSSCKAYPTSKVLPPSDMCALDEARWGVCWLNFEALIISVSAIGGTIILTITGCCLYCCCCRNKSRKYDKEDARYNAQKMERKAKSDERRSERKERLDEIRRKYGLVKDEPYQRFDS